MLESNSIAIDSIHNFCPVPIGAHRGHPEIWTMASRDRREREKAVQHTNRSIRFAADLGVPVVVSHSGNAEMSQITRKLVEYAEDGQMFTSQFERAFSKLQSRRERRARKQFPLLCESLEQLIPVLEETGVKLALEILPTWEAFPTEVEFQEIFSHFGDRHIYYWHDFGHARIRENLGFINMERWLERLAPHLAGFHIHDVIAPGQDHVMPPYGDIDFPRYAKFATDEVIRVIEPTIDTPPELIKEGLATMREAWKATPHKS